VVGEERGAAAWQEAVVVAGEPGAVGLAHVDGVVPRCAALAVVGQHRLQGVGGRLAAIFFAMPVILYQVWAFVAPGLYRHERRFALPLFISSVFLFYAGATFAYFIVFPLAFQFFVGTTPEGVRMMTDMTQYMDFAVLMFFAFGIAFESPVATVLLVRTGLVRRETLAKNRGYVILGIFIVAAFLTPPDPISQTMMAIPMYLLYEAGVLMSRVLVRAQPPDPEGDAA
jgi:sec-independent protein translocase protein TatC